MKMYGNVLEKVRIYEEKRGITYAKPDGKLYRFVKVFYVLAFIYAMFMNIFFALGVSMSDTLLHYLKTPLYSVLGFIAGLIIALVLSNYKNSVILPICSFIINALSGVGLLITFAPLLEKPEGGLKASFYWRHLIPLCLVLLLGFIINAIVIRANLKIRKTYKKIVDNAYATHHVSIEDGSLDEEKWEEVLKNI